MATLRKFVTEFHSYSMRKHSMPQPDQYYTPDRLRAFLEQENVECRQVSEGAQGSFRAH